MNRAAARVLLAFVSILVTVVAIEIGLRLTMPDPRSFAPDKVFDSDYGWRLTGHSIAQTNDLHGEQHVRRETNSLGFNDIDHDTSRPAGVRRVLFVGDSFTEGGFPVDASFVKVVERTLGDTDRWECLNMGMGGFGTAQEYKMWEKLGSLFGPEIVVAMFCTDNDVADNHPALSHIQPRPYYVLREGKPTFQPMDVTSIETTRSQRLQKRRPWYSAWLYRSYLWTLKRSASVQLRAWMRESPGMMRVMRALGFWKAKNINRDWEQFLTALPPEQARVWDEAFDATAAILTHFNEQVRARGQKLLVVWIPAQIQVYDDVRQYAARYFSNFDTSVTDLDRPRRILTEKLAGRVPLLDLLPHFKAYGGSERLYFRHDGHFTPAGHLEAGQAIAAELGRLGWTH